MPEKQKDFYALARHAIERRLYGWGFTFPVSRQMLCTQLLITGCALFAGLAALPFSYWPAAFAAGAVIASWSLWNIIKTAQAYQGLQFSRALVIRLFFGFTARMILTGVVLFVLLIQMRTPVIPLLLGLSSTVIVIAAWGISRFSGKTAKEA